MLEFGTELKRLGDVPSYFGRDPRFIEEARRAGHPAFERRFGFDYHPGTIAWFHARFRELNIDAACMNIQKELRSAGIAARLLGIPVVHRVGLPGDLRGTWEQRLAHRLLVNRILVPSRTLRAELLANCPWIDPAPVFAIPNGKRVTGPARTAKGSPVRFVIASRLDAPKRHEDLLEALSGLNGPDLPDWRLDIFGEGGRKDDLAAAAKALGLEPRARFLGFSRDLPAQLRSYDFGLLTSANEGFPNTVLEYLAAGLPAIATDTGGTSEALRHGINGLLYPPGDVTALREHLRTALSMPDARYAAWSRAAIETMERDFNPAKLAGDLHGFFADTVRQSRATPAKTD
jgi:glycosyltransferase involved in cell wall biosynthesis